MKRFLSILTPIFLIVLVSGCAVLRGAGDGPKDITWLTDQLQSEGISVSPQGPANLNLSAEESSRMVLVGQEVLESYYFKSETVARREAVRLANENPGRDVYRVDRLVALRYSPRDTGISQSLREILGRTI